MLKTQQLTSLAWVIILFVFMLFVISVIVGIVFYRKNKRLGEKMNEVERRLRRFDDNFIS